MSSFMVGSLLALRMEYKKGEFGLLRMMGLSAGELLLIAFLQACLLGTLCAVSGALFGLSCIVSYEFLFPEKGTLLTTVALWKISVWIAIFILINCIGAIIGAIPSSRISPAKLVNS
jgi:ABC-type lipoprotein release transport system permease subunit